MTLEQQSKFALSEDGEKTKKKILELLGTVNREGVDKFIQHLIEETDFFLAPSSTQFHGSEIGGLAEHSLSVYRLLKDKVNYFGLSCSDDNITISAILHDICKTNFYEPGEKWKKDDQGKWVSEFVWKVNDTLPLGHSEKSVIILQQWFKLEEGEIAAILYHMGFCTPGITTYPYSAAYSEAIKRYPLVMALHLADMEDANIKSNFCGQKALDK